MSSAQNNDIAALLKRLHDVPVAQAANNDLASIFKFLVSDPATTQDAPHWFCSQAPPLVLEAATFLLRLHAYNSGNVIHWRKRMQACLVACPQCVQRLQDIKETSTQTYFGAYSEPMLKEFYKSFSTWELETILGHCSKAQITPDAPPEPSGRTLANVPPSIFLLILSNLHHLRDPRIMSIIRAYTPDKPVTSWPLESPPVGLFLLLMDEQPEVRTWAYQQIALYKSTPMSIDHFLPTYSEVLEATTNAVTSLSSGQTAAPWSTGFAFPNDPAIIWPVYCTMLRFVPADRLQPSPTSKMDMRKVVIAHLSDTGQHFPEVLKAFLLLLSRLGPKLWEGEGEEYPQVVFNTMKNNSTYADSLQNDQPSHTHWTLQWMESYVKSLADLPGLQSLFPLIIQYLCEELQHERFKAVRASALCIAARLLDKVLVDCSPVPKERSSNDTSPILSVALESLEIHASVFTSVAFGKAHMVDPWTDARAYSRTLIQTALKMDARVVLYTLHRLATVSSKGGSIPVPKVRETLWRKTYESVLPNDSDGIAAIVNVLSNVTHADDLNEAAFLPLFKHQPNRDDLSKVLHAVNRSLKVFRTGFADAVSRFLDFTEPSTALALLRQKGVTESIMRMMFSPLEALRSPAQSLVGLALDAESRADCFRAILQANPDGAFAGMSSVLEVFVKITATLPEACGLSKALALCLTDIIDVLCATTDGLLHKPQFLRGFHAAGPEVQLPKLWSLMTKAITQIFQRTPRWAEYFENDVMITWMRDALIFGRDMLAQRKAIESGALALSPQSSHTRGKSHTGTKMVDDLQPVLLELTRWLRLTDEELLFQAFALLQSLLSCFRETQVKPSEAALQKLQKHVKDAKTPDPKRPQTKLDSTRLDHLQDAIGAFDAKEEDSEDEIQIISHTIKPPPERKKDKATAKADGKGSVKGVVKEEVRTKAKAEPIKGNVKSRPLATPVATKPIRPESGRRPPAKSAISSYFTAEDQRKLDTASTIPKFKAKAPTTLPSTSSSKATLSTVTLPSARDGTKSGASSSAPSVSAASSNESSSEDSGDGIVSLAKHQRSPIVRKPMERRGIMMLDIPGQGRNPALDRIAQARNAQNEARRTAMRLKPDITPLHRVILSWNYDAEGAQPPGQAMKLLHVPDRFENEHHYRATFEPLLLLECWAQMQQSKEGNSERYSCQIMTRQYTDEWVDLDIQITDSVAKDWSLSDTEIILLRHPNGKQGCLCKVQNYRANMTTINATLRMISLPGGPQINSTWMLQKVLSLTTVHREYSALMGLPYYDLYPVILKPKLPEPARTNPQEVSETMKAYSLNEPQAKAILSALRTNGFSLIQGPPGTGKTSTICGLVQAFLARRPRPATAIYAGRSSGPADRMAPKKKILLCAPSNAAIDEITHRLKEGVSGPGRTLIAPKVVRVGGGKMSLAVKDVSLDFLVEQKLNADAQARADSKDVGSDIAVLRSKLDGVKRQREQKLNEMMTLHDNPARTFSLEEDVRGLNKQRIALTSQLDKLRDQQKSSYRALDALGRKMRAEILQDADVICTTLAGSGHELLEAFDFEMVVIDEAAQAIELSSLIPLKYRCSRCVMVGDPQQLPPTVISTEASKYSYNQSLFVRLQKDRPDAVHLLSIQYRMHPDISVLPSRLFYRGRLQDGPGMQVKTQKPWHEHPKFGPYRFFNVARGVEETGSSHSFFNRAEADTAVALYNRMHQEFASKGVNFTVGVVTMYKAQMFELRRAFDRRFGSSIAGLVDFNTVDGFQGQEKDVIILSCVRAGPGVERVGFLADVRRMNVALTRAKSSVFILGNAATLERSNEDWKTIVNDARTRSCLMDVDVAYFTAPVRPSEKAPPQTKAPAKSKANMAPPPSDLMTPSQMAAANSRTSTSQPMSGVEPTPARAAAAQVASLQASAPPHPSTSSSSLTTNGTSTVLGQKRPAEEPAAGPPDAKRRPPPGPNAGRPKPKLPPPRKKEQSMFIPSKRPGAQR